MPLGAARPAGGDGRAAGPPAHRSTVRAGLRGARAGNICGVTAEGFDLDEFLGRPLTAHVATSGPTVRPTWFLWEDEAFWILSGRWAKLPDHLAADPMMALVVDICDVATGEVQQVIARGRAEVLPFDTERGYRKLSRYLGLDETTWDTRFLHYLRSDPADSGALWVRMKPERLTSSDLSFAPSRT